MKTKTLTPRTARALNASGLTKKQVAEQIRKGHMRQYLGIGQASLKELIAWTGATEDYKLLSGRARRVIDSGGFDYADKAGIAKAVLAGALPDLKQDPHCRVRVKTMDQVRAWVGLPPAERTTGQYVRVRAEMMKRLQAVTEATGMPHFKLVEAGLEYILSHYESGKKRP